MKSTQKKPTITKKANIKSAFLKNPIDKYQKPKLLLFDLLTIAYSKLFVICFLEFEISYS
ncbi:MAG: hypothetical protein A2V93_02280 [Ignavibacteria bacterium RBG_16_34_14]|nr:MAG: hypothetical protein A2V93_02280 [Ignavibacteria bacterium RBG_16_34_14]